MTRIKVSKQGSLELCVVAIAAYFVLVTLKYFRGVFVDESSRRVKTPDEQSQMRATGRLRITFLPTQNRRLEVAPR